MHLIEEEEESVQKTRQGKREGAFFIILSRPSSSCIATFPYGYRHDLHPRLQTQEMNFIPPNEAAKGLHSQRRTVS